MEQIDGNHHEMNSLGELQVSWFNFEGGTWYRIVLEHDSSSCRGKYN